MSLLEERFANLWDTLFPEVDLYREIRFAYPRRYRGDFVAPSSKIIIEIQGGTWSRGKMGHNSGSGIQKDAEKMQVAAFLGFQVIPIIDKHIIPETLEGIKKLIEEKKPTKEELTSYLYTLERGEGLLIFIKEEFKIQKCKFAFMNVDNNEVSVLKKKKKNYSFKIEDVILPCCWPSKKYKFPPINKP